MSDQIKLSVIIPAHNEAKRIRRTILDIDKYLGKQDYDSEIIVVDNASLDKTAQIAKKVKNTRAKIFVIQTPIAGKGHAVKLGVESAKGKYIMFMDADNATPISEIEKFWPYLEKGIEVVIGDRYLDIKHRAKQPLFRAILSRGSNLLIQTVLIPHIHDTQAGFKAFAGFAAKEIFKLIRITGFAFDMELLAIALQLSYRIKAVPIVRDQEGGSTVGASAFISSLRDLFIIKWNALTGKYSTK